MGVGRRDKMEEKDYIEQYRQYSQAKMLECIEDAKKIFDTIFGQTSTPPFDRIAILIIATQLFDKRVSPYHYWKQKKIREERKHE